MTVISNTTTLAHQANLPVRHVQELKDHYIVTYDADASTGKKWGVGLASAVFPGLGQAINGQWGKGIAFFLGNIALQALQMITALNGKPGVAMISLVGNIATRIGAIVDAVKSSKSEFKEIIPKEQGKLNIKV